MQASADQSVQRSMRSCDPTPVRTSAAHRPPRPIACPPVRAGPSPSRARPRAGSPIVCPPVEGTPLAVARPEGTSERSPSPGLGRGPKSLSLYRQARPHSNCLSPCWAPGSPIVCPPVEGGLESQEPVPLSPVPLSPGRAALQLPVPLLDRPPRPAAPGPRRGPPLSVPLLRELRLPSPDPIDSLGSHPGPSPSRSPNPRPKLEPQSCP
jgi:hypothetical protein